MRTILLSVISLLNEPNTSSPANVDASVVYRRWKTSEGKDSEYADIVKKQVADTRAEAEKDGVTVPTTVEDYCVKPPSDDAAPAEENDYDFYDYGGASDDSDPEDEDNQMGGDSGQGDDDD